MSFLFSKGAVFFTLSDLFMYPFFFFNYVALFGSDHIVVHFSNNFTLVLCELRLPDLSYKVTVQ